MAGLVLRDGKTRHLRMRVPRRYGSVERRGEITRSLKTFCRREALVRLPAAEAMVLADLDARLAAGTAQEAPDLFASAVALAATPGVSYRQAKEVAREPLQEILDRLDKIGPRDGPEVARALLGGVEAPKLMLSALVAAVEEASAHDNRYKSETQMRLWRNPRDRAVRNLIAALGEDRPVTSIDAAAARRHRAWWQQRRAHEGQSADTANKDFSNMGSLLARYYDSIDMPDPPRPYSGVAIRDARAAPKRTKEIPLDCVRERWLAPGAFDGLNEEARDVLLISLETGCRQSEIHDLPASSIVLDADIPHIRVAFEDGEERREVKNVASLREVPLVGLALAAAKRHPAGFPRYRGKRGYSATINRFLRDRDLLPDGRYSARGTRHLWEGRLKAAGVPSDDRAR